MWFDQSWSNDGMRVERVVFDLYGTLLDVGGLAGRLRPFLGDAAPEVLGRWRKAQIERAGSDLVEGLVLAAAVQLPGALDLRLAPAPLSLPAFADAAAALDTLARAGVQRWILSNGTFAMIRAALDAAGLVLDEVRSADQVRAYKTDARVYSLVPREGTLFVSGNGWDAEGAKRFGLAVAWLDRGGPEPGAAPDLRFGSLAELAAQVAWRDRGVRVVKGTELDTNTPQTPGMSRAAAITNARVGAEKLWMGTVTIHPNAKTGAHHHGELESVIYVVSGRARMRWGERLEFTAEAGPGDFIYVPPFVPHQEINANRDQELSCVVVRSGQEPVVVNLDIAPAEPPEEVRWIDPIHH